MGTGSIVAIALAGIASIALWMFLASLDLERSRGGRQPSSAPSSPTRAGDPVKDTAAASPVG